MLQGPSSPPHAAPFPERGSALTPPSPQMLAIIRRCRMGMQIWWLQFVPPQNCPFEELSPNFSRLSTLYLFSN